MLEAGLILFVGSLFVGTPVLAQSYGVRPGGPQLNQAPGIYGNPYNMVNPYNRSAGIFNPNPYGNAFNYPVFGVPQSLGNGFYHIPSGGTNLPMWRAPSGYYYPWAPRPTGFNYGMPMPVLVVPQTTQTPAPALPPVSVALSDLDKFLEENKKNPKLQERDYTNMSRRIKDLQAKERNLKVAGGGSLEPDDEAQLRRDLEQVGSDLSWRLNR